MLIYHRFIDWFVKIISSYKFIMMFHAIHAAPMQPLSTFRRDVKRSPTWLEKGPSETETYMAMAVAPATSPNCMAWVRKKTL